MTNKFNDDTLKMFEEVFCVKDKGAVDGFALLLLKATISNLKQFLTTRNNAYKETLIEKIEGMNEPTPSDVINLIKEI